LGRNVDNGRAKIAKHINLVDPDIVGIQEVTNSTEFEQLMNELEKLDPKWTAAYIVKSNTAIITKHLIIDEDTYTVQAGIGTTIYIADSTPVHVFSMHLAYLSYGPYAANNKLVVDEKIIDIGEKTPSYSRVNNVQNLINDKTFQKWLKQSINSIPLIVFGDFNCPSHLDWVEENKQLHGNWVYKWPATFLLETKTKLIDSFREVYPDPVKFPGITWSTINKASGSEWNYSVPEPQDRIDFIYYRSSNLKTIDSQVYAGEFVPTPGDVKKNDWPTDHYAVVSKLEWVDSKESE